MIVNFAAHWRSASKRRAATLRRLMMKQSAIQCLIDGATVPEEWVGPPVMNYGQLHRWRAFEIVQYEYVMAAPDFIDRASPWFSTYSKEFKADCKIEAPDEDTPQLAFASLGYPRVDQLFRSHSALACQLFLSLPLELNNLFASKTSDFIRYAANSVDRFSCEAGEIRFGGIAFDMQSKAK